MQRLQRQSFDDKANLILEYLFDTTSKAIKIEQHADVLATFEQMDVVEKYQLFFLIQRFLPEQARLFFAAENYQQKIETIVEVIDGIKYI
ncbi:hypothetical protein QR665_07730 [Acinetobacter gerneri]|uniref:hypothetical protein n=1 Tax=Acinetobacter gerneri TaxID=202952 RepID=UPI002936D069|nr:hypothetical protein [Acinetobacter gerneri]MDV2439367.1 hypothetical protein [Acinetobacter gerneri]